MGESRQIKAITKINEDLANMKVVAPKSEFKFESCYGLNQFGSASVNIYLLLIFPYIQCIPDD